MPASCKIPGHPVHEYAGMIFAYSAKARRPSSSCRARTAWRSRGAVVAATKETWTINWFQQIENSLDPVHVSFVHQTLRVGDVRRAR